MNIARNTAKRMLASIEQQLQALASEQQAMNGNRGGSSQYKCGGKVKRRKMQDAGNVPPGGYTNSPFNWGQNFPSGFGMDQYKTNFGTQELPYGNIQPFQPMYTGDLATGSTVAVPDNKLQNTGVGNIGAMNQRIGNITPSVTGGINLPGLQKSNNPFSDPNFKAPQGQGFGMGNVMGMLPGLFKLGAGLLQPRAQHLNANQFQNPYEQQALAQMPSQYRIDPLLNEYKNAYANSIRNVNNMGNSRGERMANYGAAQNQYGQQVGGAYAEKFNQENQMATRRAMMMNQQGEQRSRVNLGVQNMNDQNIAASQNNRMAYLGNAASDFQKNYLINRQMEGQQKAQDAWLWAIKNQPHFADWVLGGVDPNNLAGLYNRK